MVKGDLIKNGKFDEIEALVKGEKNSLQSLR